MRTINKKDLQAEFQFFNTEIYNSKPIYITSEKYFEGGVYIGAPFKEKIEFYLLANKMSGILKELFAKEKIYIANNSFETKGKKGDILSVINYKVSFFFSSSTASNPV